MTVTDILDQYGVEYRLGGAHHHVSHGWAGVDCMMCSPGTGSFKLGIHLQWGACSCWSCGTFPLAEVFRALLNEPWGKCIELAKSIRNAPIPRDLKPKGNLELPKGVGPLLDCHRRYLRGRGFDPNELERLWKLQGIGLAPRLAWSIFIPIIFRGEMVSWTTRTLTNGGRRYFGAASSQEKIPSKSLLFGADFVRHSVIVTEGPLDTMRIGPGAVATLGVKWTKAQLLQLSRVPTRTIMFDTTPDAQQRAKELCDALGCYPGTTQRVEVDAKDPGEMTKKQVELIRRRFLK